MFGAVFRRPLIAAVPGAAAITAFCLAAARRLRPSRRPISSARRARSGSAFENDDNGVLTAYDAASGAQIYQQRIGTFNPTLSASPVAAQGRIDVSSEDGDVYVIRAGATDELLATNRMREAVMATPAISDDTLIVRGQRHLFAVREKRRQPRGVP